MGLGSAQPEYGQWPEVRSIAEQLNLFSYADTHPKSSTCLSPVISTHQESNNWLPLSCPRHGSSDPISLSSSVSMVWSIVIFWIIGHRNDLNSFSKLRICSKKTSIQASDYGRRHWEQNNRCYMNHDTCALYQPNCTTMMAQITRFDAAKNPKEKKTTSWTGTY